jgi:hypothetical protein
VPQQISNASDDRQTETKALPSIARLIAHLVELLEDVVELIGRDADAGILDLDAKTILNPVADDSDVSMFGIPHRVSTKFLSMRPSSVMSLLTPSVQASTRQPSPLAEAIGV